jgi:hypothetical protein
MPHMKLIGGTDASPTVHVGRPEIDKHGLATHPVAVITPDGRTLAIGHTRKHRRWTLPETTLSEIPTVEARIAVERTVVALMAQCESLMQQEIREDMQRQKLQWEILDAEARIAKANALIAVNREMLSMLQGAAWD